jgi:hypothetical protein
MFAKGQKVKTYPRESGIRFNDRIDRQFGDKELTVKECGKWIGESLVPKQYLVLAEDADSRRFADWYFQPIEVPKKATLVERVKARLAKWFGRK